MDNEEKRLTEVLDKSVMSLHERAKTRVRVYSESEVFEVILGMYQGSVFSHYSSILVDGHRIGKTGCVMSASDLILMSETIQGLWNKFTKWEEAFENKI